MSSVGVGTIALSLIRENPVALRAVNKKDPAYAELVDSIRDRGVLNPVSVREQVDPVTNETYYGLIDGLHRFTASKDAGLDAIPAYVKNMDDGQVEEAQIIANAQKIETKFVEYSKQIQRILVRNPLMTVMQLSKLLNKSPQWVGDRLGLLKLAPSIQPLVDGGDIVLSNAYALAKLPEDEQLEFLQAAQVEQPTEFCPRVQERVKAIRDAKRKGANAEKIEFQPTAFLQKLGDFKDEYENLSVGRVLLQKFSVTDPLEAWKMGIAWALHLDPESAQAQVQKHNDHQAKVASEKEARKAEHERKKAEEAAAKTVEAAA
jgi:ParB family chromosome partitioning protein